MTQADQIRQFLLAHYIAPAKRHGLFELTIRAGDVHRDMALVNAMPAVCSAIRSRKFHQLAAATLRDSVGPANGANVYFRFALSPRSDNKEAEQSDALNSILRDQPPKPHGLDLANALVLVSCAQN
jgi:5-methylcytosine-specific restriction protein B